MPYSVDLINQNYERACWVNPAWLTHAQKAYNAAMLRHFVVDFCCGSVAITAAKSDGKVLATMALL